MRLMVALMALIAGTFSLTLTACGDKDSDTGEESTEVEEQEETEDSGEEGEESEEDPAEEGGE